MINIKNPKISVLMPVYNGEKYLKEAINSILNQSFTAFEFLLINDGSTDISKKIIATYEDARIRYINNGENKGLIFSLNLGLKEANGKYIARMDQDDISSLDRLQKQYDFLENNPDIALVGGWAEIIDEKGEKIGNKRLPLNYDEIKFNLLFHNPFIHSTIFFRKDIIKKISGYNNKYEHAEDYKLYSTLVKNYKIVNVPEFFLKFRIHNSSIGQTTKTKLIQNDTVKKIVFNNISDYFSLNNHDFEIIYYIKKISNIKKLFKIISLHKKILNSYIKKENLSKEQIKKIVPYYKEKQKNSIKWYIKNKLNL